MLLVVTESSGSSPGRQGYKMAVGADGKLSGSIGGGIMEVNLVEQCREVLSGANTEAEGLTAFTKQQIHRKDAENSSGMICSGKQTVVFRLLSNEDLTAVKSAIRSLTESAGHFLHLSNTMFAVRHSDNTIEPDHAFRKTGDDEFSYLERIGPKNNLFIIGGGHCALALSELMSKMDFRIAIFDDRPELNTIEKNRFADKINIIDDYSEICDLVPAGDRNYVVVMTLGYKSDGVVIRKLIDKEFKYFGVLGSKAKMSSMFKDLRKDGFDLTRLELIHTPIGIPINSRTPDEIAVSIAAEIIAVKNAS